MLARIDTRFYDAEGRRTHQVSGSARRYFRPTAPFGSYLSQPVEQLASIEEVRTFLMTCRYVSDEKQFGRADFWMPPQEFERERKGDCEDFALWTWRQLVGLGFQSRFVVGPATRYGENHGWVTLQRDGDYFLLEPQARAIGLELPRLTVRHYKPQVSAEVRDGRVRYFVHEQRAGDLAVSELPQFIGEWLRIWGSFWLRNAPRVPGRLAMSLLDRIARP